MFYSLRNVPITNVTVMCNKSYYHCILYQIYSQDSLGKLRVAIRATTPLTDTTRKRQSQP